MPNPTKPLAFIDIETTGLEPNRHEILEIAVVRADGRTLEPLVEVAVSVQAYFHNADRRALAVNGRVRGVNPPDAIYLGNALMQIAPLLEGAIAAGHNPAFDLAFLRAAYRRHGWELPPMDHHMLDTASLAWPLYAVGVIESLSLDAVGAALGITRPSPHRALDDAHASRQIAARLLAAMGSLPDLLQSKEVLP